MDAIVLLKNDHKTVEDLFKKYEKAGERAHAEKRRLLEKITHELAMGRKELQELGGRMEKAKADAPAEPLAVKSARR